jgi:hypothetical protein
LAEFAAGCVSTELQRKNGDHDGKGNPRETATARPATKPEPAKVMTPQAKPKPKRNPDTGRLPDGAEFAAKYDEAAKKWRGKLVIGGAVFDGAESGIFRLLINLDAAYRASLAPAAGAVLEQPAACLAAGE